jgi:hypothetical protein
VFFVFGYGGGGDDDEEDQSSCHCLLVQICIAIAGTSSIKHTCASFQDCSRIHMKALGCGKSCEVKTSFHRLYDHFPD